MFSIHIVCLASIHPLRLQFFLRMKLKEIYLCSNATRIIWVCVLMCKSFIILKCKVYYVQIYLFTESERVCVRVCKLTKMCLHKSLIHTLKTHLCAHVFFSLPFFFTFYYYISCHNSALCAFGFVYAMRVLEKSQQMAGLCFVLFCFDAQTKEFTP